MNEIKCSYCNDDLLTTNNSIDYRLKLSCEKIRSGSGAVTDMLIYPMIDHDRYFCGLGCMKSWFQTALSFVVNKESENDE